MKLKLSELGRLKFPDFEKIECYKSYGNKYCRLEIDTGFMRDKTKWRFRGWVCGTELSAPYTPEGLETLIEKMHDVRKEVALKLYFAEADND